MVWVGRERQQEFTRGGAGKRKVVWEEWEKERKKERKEGLKMKAMCRAGWIANRKKEGKKVKIEKAMLWKTRKEEGWEGKKKGGGRCRMDRGL